MWGAVAPVSGSGGRVGSGLAVVQGGDTWNVTIQGAVDKEGTADALRKLAADRDRQTGRATTIRVGLKR